MVFTVLIFRGDSTLVTTTTERKKVLLVDDEPFILSVMQSFLDPGLYDIDTASCGNDAIELIKSKSYDCVVSDVRMPNGTGPQFLMAAREMNKQNPAIIFVTGFSDIPPEELLAKGADSFILKPFNVEDFAREVGRLARPLAERLATKPMSYEALKGFKVKAQNALKSGSGGDAHFGRGGFFTTTPPEGIRINQSARFTIELDDNKVIQGCGRVLWIRRPSSLNPMRAGAGILMEYLDQESLKLYMDFIKKNDPFEVIPRDLA